MIESSHALLGTHPAVRIVAYASDYFTLLRERHMQTQDRVLALFLGSNVGNFEPGQAHELFRLLASALQPGDGLLVGYDLKKEPSILELAYDDPTGVTAAFNKNLLGRINRELGGDFNIDAFSFFARYHEDIGAVRSYLRADRAQRVTIPAAGITVELAAGETIHTESSYKFAQEEMVALLADCGFGERRTFLDAAGRYALGLFVAT